MMKRSCIVALLLALLAGAGLILMESVSAQDPVRPPQPKPTPTQQNPSQKERKGQQRQGAQAEEQQLGKEDVIRVDTDLVQLDVSVIDQNAQAVFNLGKENFAVYEDKVAQNIEDVSREEVPVSVGFVIDTSGSMRSRLQTVSDATLGLIKQLRDDDEGFLAQFKAEPELVQDFTADKRELEDAVGELFTSGGTALLDAIIATADYAHEKGQRRRKALIIVSDGLEKNSSVKEKEVMEAIKEDEVQIYLVGFIDEEESDKGLFGKSSGKKAKELLSRLAEDSGGRAFFPKDISEMPAIAAQIAKDIRTQYVVSYYPSNSLRDGSFRSVKVMVTTKDNRKLFARTRQGYYAKNAKGESPNAPNRKIRGN